MMRHSIALRLIRRIVGDVPQQDAARAALVHASDAAMFDAGLALCSRGYSPTEGLRWLALPVDEAFVERLRRAIRPDSLPTRFS